MPYEPGSTAKPMNVAAAYSLDVIDDDTLFDCEGFETIAGQMIRCGALREHMAYRHRPMY